jgi:hypothetical protein
MNICKMNKKVIKTKAIKGNRSITLKTNATETKFQKFKNNT